MIYTSKKWIIISKINQEKNTPIIEKREKGDYGKLTSGSKGSKICVLPGTVNVLPWVVIIVS